VVSMRKLTFIQFKATLLCIVFASNTILGFACALDVNMAIEHIIHTDEAHVSHVHVHTDGEKHHHHHHEKEPKEKDDCCNSHVVSFEHLDKIIATSVSIDFTLHFFESPTSLFLNTILQSSASSTRKNYTFRNSHLPTEDIRVSIRSFQI
jgi:ABC-type nickel/cobalt efflux system permease component RcnA